MKHSHHEKAKGHMEKAAHHAEKMKHHHEQAHKAMKHVKPEKAEHHKGKK